MKINVITSGSNWLENHPACTGIKIGTVHKDKVTEKSERERLIHASEYWRKRNKIVKGCTCW